MRDAMRLWVRRSARQPALTLFLLLSLALALGGGTAALSLASAVLWRELPFDEASQLVDIEPRRDGRTRAWISKAELEALRAPMSPFASMAGYTPADFSAPSEPGLPPEPLLGMLVSADFFRVFRIDVSQGQLPSEDAYTRGGERVVLLSHELWQRRYRGAPDIVGRAIRLSGPEYLNDVDGDYRVIGVLPSSLWLFWKRTDIVLPFRPDANLDAYPNGRVLERVVGRLAPATGVDGARALSEGMVARVGPLGGAEPLSAISMSAFQDAFFRDVRPHLLIVAVVACVVFLLAATNVGLSAATQALVRRRETAIRLAVGAGHGRLLLETFRETGISVAVAGVVGLLIALWIIGALATQVPGGWLSRLPGQQSAVRIDGAVAVCLFAALAVLALVSSGVVHLSARRLRPWLLLGSVMSTDSPASRAWRAAMVAGEIAICTSAVVTATVLVWQLSSLRGVDLGIEPDHAVATWLSLDMSKHRDPAARVRYYDAITTELQQLPAMEAVGAVDLPFHFNWQSERVHVDSRPDLSETSGLARAATPDYLAASGIALIDGRWIAAADREGSPDVAVLSESLARALWPQGGAIGQVVRSGASPDRAMPAIVVGIVSDTRHAPHQPPDRILYRAVAQSPPSWLYFVVRARTTPEQVMSAVSAAVWRVDPDQPLEGPWPMQKWIDDRTVHVRFLVMLTGIFAALGAALAAAGLYGLTAFWVAESKRDLGIRRAIGARDRQIVKWFAWRVVAVVVPGLIAGALLHVGAMRAVIATIEGLQPSGWMSIATGLALVAACAAAGALVPFRRALAADAMSLMR